jgi:two-component system sensor histidine kinase UhpB
MTSPLRILLVEDDLVDRMACRRAFAARGGVALSEADSGLAGLACVAEQALDCVLLDYRLPDMTGLEFLARLDAARLAALPVLMLTGADSAAVAAEALRRGARDYLLKDLDGRYLELLPGAVERLLREQALMRDKQQMEARYQTLVEQMQAINYVVGRAPRQLQYVSPQIRVLGYTPGEWLADPGLHGQCMDAEARPALLAAIEASRREDTPLRLEYRLRARSGEFLWFRDQADVVRDAHGAPLFMQGSLLDITASKLAEQALQASRDSLRRLAGHQETIREQERQRIAREIHDELGGLLTGIKAYISVAAERRAQAGLAPEPLLDEANGLAQDAIETVRRVITDLRPSVLDQLGIWAALEWQVAQTAQRSGLRCRCSIAPAVAGLNLDGGRSIMLFRVVQEALTNVLRHAQASALELSVERTGAGLELRVSDDGRGIAPDGGQQASWGILGMRERSLLFGGELTLAPGQPRGTVLCLRLPLETT